MVQFLDLPEYLILTNDHRFEPTCDPHQVYQRLLVVVELENPLRNAHLFHILEENLATFRRDYVHLNPVTGHEYHTLIHQFMRVQPLQHILKRAVPRVFNVCDARFRVRYDHAGYLGHAATFVHNL